MRDCRSKAVLVIRMIERSYQWDDKFSKVKYKFHTFTGKIIDWKTSMQEILRVCKTFCTHD